MNFATRALLELQRQRCWPRAHFAVSSGGPLHPRNHRSDGRHWRRLFDHHNFDGLYGGVLTVQTFPTLKAYGAQSQTGYLVAVSLVRELGPVYAL